MKCQATGLIRASGRGWAVVSSVAAATIPDYLAINDKQQ
jgi:hypothetical protein